MVWTIEAQERTVDGKSSLPRKTIYASNDKEDCLNVFKQKATFKAIFGENSQDSKILPYYTFIQVKEWRNGNPYSRVWYDREKNSFIFIKGE